MTNTHMTKAEAKIEFKAQSTLKFVCNIMQINNSMNSMFVHLLCEIMILSRASSTNSSEFNIHNMRQTIGSIYLIRDPELEMLYAFQKFSGH